MARVRPIIQAIQPIKLRSSHNNNISRPKIAIGTPLHLHLKQAARDAHVRDCRRAPSPIQINRMSARLWAHGQWDNTRQFDKRQADKLLLLENVDLFEIFITGSEQTRNNKILDWAGDKLNQIELQKAKRKKS